MSDSLRLESGRVSISREHQTHREGWEDLEWVLARHYFLGAGGCRHVCTPAATAPLVQILGKSFERAHGGIPPKAGISNSRILSNNFEAPAASMISCCPRGFKVFIFLQFSASFSLNFRRFFAHLFCSFSRPSKDMRSSLGSNESSSCLVSHDIFKKEASSKDCSYTGHAKPKNKVLRRVVSA